MARKKKALLQLPDKAGQDFKTIQGIVGHWSEELEGLGKEVFTWAKAHKFFLVVIALVVGFCKYFLAETENKREDEDY